MTINDLLFYGGTIIIIIFYAGLLIKRFKGDHNIDINKYKWIILTYITIMILSIFTWKILVGIINAEIQTITTYNQNMQKIENEE